MAVLDSSTIIAGLFALTVAIIGYYFTEHSKSKWSSMEEAYRYEREKLCGVITNLWIMWNIVRYKYAVTSEDNEPLKDRYENVLSLIDEINIHFSIDIKKPSVANASIESGGIGEAEYKKLVSSVDEELNQLFENRDYEISEQVAMLRIICSNKELLDSIFSQIEEMYKIASWNPKGEENYPNMTLEKATSLIEGSISEFAKAARAEVEKVRVGKERPSILMCPKCYHANSINHIYCLNCGARLDDSAYMRSCPTCFNTTEMKSSYCPYCGSELKKS